MDDNLPDDQKPDPTSASNADEVKNQGSTISAFAKELEPASGLNVSPAEGMPELVETGKDIELPSDVASAGVKNIPTSVQIPRNISQMGVTPAGDNVSSGSGTTVALPLTDDQIAQGLRKSITDSIRWLAWWCQRQLQLLQKKQQS